MRSHSSTRRIDTGTPVEASNRNPCIDGLRYTLSRRRPDSISFFYSSRRRPTRFLNVTGVQTCALPIRLNSSHIQKSRMPSSACDWSSDGSGEHKSELQSHSEISYAVFCLRSEERRVGRSEEHTSELQSHQKSRMPSS